MVRYALFYLNNGFEGILDCLPDKEMGRSILPTPATDLEINNIG